MEPAKKFEVDQGNSRGSNISNEEIDQAIKDMMNWISTNIPNSDLPAPASPEQASQFPYAVGKLLLTHNGGIQLQETFKTLPLGEIAEATEVGRVSIHWKVDYIPFAKNTEGDYLVVEGNGEVFQWNIDIGVIEQVGASLGLYLEKIRNGMVSRRFQYIDEDCGLIEGV